MGARFREDVPVQAGAVSAAPGHGAERAVARLVAGAGIAAAALFIIVGVVFRLQSYGDGALFSYAVAAGESWAFHWHNISVRVFVYLWAMLPAEIYARATGDGAGAVALYGFLFFSAQAVGLGLTAMLDRTRGRQFFLAAALSTAVLCPLVFGFPTEMWFAHAVFWPALTLVHRGAADGGRAFGALVAAFAALVLSHEGGVVLGAAIVVTALLRGPADRGFRRALAAFALAGSVWLAIRLALRPDAYISDALETAALSFVAPENLASRAVVLIALTVAGFLALRTACVRLGLRHADVIATAIAVGVLVAYWVLAAPSVHAADRYRVRTVLLVLTPVIGGLAALLVVTGEGGLWPALARWAPGRWLDVLATGLRRASARRGAAGVLALVLLVHGVETGRFVSAWTAYQGALRELATGASSDGRLGAPRFASSARLPAGVEALDWESTTPYLSVLVAPRLQPARLVVSPQSVYIWMSCADARRHAAQASAVPDDARGLIASHACANRD